MAAAAPTVAQVLTSLQHDTIAHYRALGVPASWFVSDRRGSDGEVEVIAIGPDFIWSFLVYPDGDVASSEAAHGGFETGIHV